MTEVLAHVPPIAIDSTTHAVDENDPQTRAGERVWRSWHLHTASGARTLQDRVVAEVVRPVVDDQPEHPWFFIRYWQGGPHLRLRVANLDADAAAHVEQQLRRRLDVAGALEAGEEPVDAISYQENAVRQAAAETGADRVVSALQAPGVQRAVYQPEIERYGGAALMSRTEDAFHLSSRLAAGLLPRSSSDAARGGVALQATMAAALALGDREVQAEYFRRSIEAWRAWAGAAGCTGAQIDRLCRIEADVSPSAKAGLLSSSTTGPFRAFYDSISAVAGLVHRTTSTPPGQVVFSHVHMFHNRLGRSMLEELRTYAWLAHTFPAGDVAS